MTSTRPRRLGGRTLIDIPSDQRVWALYGRESDDPTGSAEQVQRQLKALRAYVAAEGGGRIGEEFSENDTSAFKRVRTLLPDGTYGYRVHRPDWDRMLTGLRRGLFNCLAIPNIDRGMRDPRDLEDLIDLVEHYGVYIVGLTGSVDLTTDDGITSARTSVAQRNSESRNTSRRVSQGKFESAMKGKNSGGPTRPFGWRTDRIRANKREEKHIKEAVPRLLGDLSLESLRKEWTKRGIKTVTGVDWTVQTLRQIFTNPRLCGWRTYKNEVLRTEEGNPVNGEWDALITVDQHLALRAKIPSYAHSETGRGKGHVTKYLLSPFVRCGNCNYGMNGKPRKRANGRVVIIYFCPSPANGGCGKVTAPAHVVDEYVLKAFIREQKRQSFRKNEDIPPWDKTGELKALQKRIDEQIKAYQTGAISASRHFSSLKEMEKEESRLKAEQRKHERKREMRSAIVVDIEEKWKDPTFALEQRQAAIGASIQAIVIKMREVKGSLFDPDQIDIIWREEIDVA